MRRCTLLPIMELDGEEDLVPALRAGYYQVDVKAGEWVVPERYQDLKPLGIGAFGTVW